MHPYISGFVLGSSAVFNMAKFCQILTLFVQVMMSEASGTNYDGYIRYRPYRDNTKLKRSGCELADIVY